MNKLVSLLLTLIISSILFSCGSNGNNTNSTANWQTVGNSFPISNIAFNSIAISNNGTVYASGSADVNNGLVLTRIFTVINAP